MFVFLLKVRLKNEMFWKNCLLDCPDARLEQAYLLYKCVAILMREKAGIQFSPQSRHPIPTSDSNMRGPNFNSFSLHIKRCGVQLDSD